MILRIDTSDKSEVIVSIKGHKELTRVSSKNEFGSQVLLVLVLRALKKQSINFKGLTGIEVYTGPGSYTGLKVGVAVANSLGFALDLPVNGKKIETDLRYT